MPSKRDYKAEYARRITRGLAKGLSRSQARGHGKTLIAKSVKTKRYDKRLESGLKQIRRGKPLTKAAKSIAVAPERLRKYVAQTGVAKKRGRRWTIGPDQRKRRVRIPSAGRSHTIFVKNYKDAARVGRYMEAVRKFLATNDESVIKNFIGDSVRDVNGKRFEFETRPNALYRLSASQTETFEDIYRIVA